ncbi:hypothetical protein BsWGS_03488 [Bradybaena similaris]
MTFYTRCGTVVPTLTRRSGDGQCKEFDFHPDELETSNWVPTSNQPKLDLKKRYQKSKANVIVSTSPSECLLVYSKYCCKQDMRSKPEGESESFSHTCTDPRCYQRLLYY